MYRVYGALSLCLLFVLVCMPLAPVFADEIPVENTPDSPSVAEPVTPLPENPPSDSTVVTTTQDAQPPTVEPAPVDNSVLPNTPLQIVDEPEGTPSDTPIDTTPVTGTEEDLTSSTVDTPIDENGDMSPTPETGATTTDGSVVVTDDPVDPEVVNEVEAEVTLPEGVTEEATATPLTTSQNVVSVVTNDENRFSFSKNECTTVGDGTFYCATPTEAPQVLNADRIFSALDAEGDKEIYLEKNSELTPLTNNQADDDAPYFDEVSNTAVWHRLIDGRFQIIQYDFDEESEKQLTYDSFNNMQPSVFGDTVVWQGWVGSDWEIFMLEDEKVTMLTDNTTHDIAPSVNGTHVVWQSFEGDVWRVKVYDLRTGLIDTVSDSGGGSIENPRFVLVYDAKMETGDIETRGYDLKSGEVVDLASKPTPVPEEIPDPDQTGEERALVSPATQPKQKVDSDENDDVGTTTDNGLDDGDIVIPSFETPSEEPVVTEATSTPAGTVDVLVPSFENSATSTDTEHIEDLIVEPYVPLEETLEENV